MEVRLQLVQNSELKWRSRNSDDDSSKTGHDNVVQVDRVEEAFCLRKERPWYIICGGKEAQSRKGWNIGENKGWEETGNTGALERRKIIPLN